ncbi:hypothetical protein D3880_17320 [Pseudomonas cavernae]|uniref:Uncharacterized protein n=1 Tax=Pseudomonas cavernae TaxID=2320867 RepID=A0A385Z683_9PSED|nr:hypothetical protein D3880_17320 [Pseudomonas cavernae]
MSKGLLIIYRGCAYPLRAGTNGLEPASDLLRVGKTALKTASECSFTTRKLRFLSRFRLVFL